MRKPPAVLRLRRRRNKIDIGGLAPAFDSNAATMPPLPILRAAHRPKDLPDCKTPACRGERCGPPLADNRARSIDWREIHRLPPPARHGPVSIGFQSRPRSL